jgi:hypothetical protein
LRPSFFGTVDSRSSSFGAPKDVDWLLDYLFATELDGRNACLSDGVQRARPPRDFSDLARALA